MVSQFNKAQTEKGRETCHNTAATNWLQKYRPKVALHPSMTDYCDTCKHVKQQLSQNQAVLNRLQQSSRVAPLKVSLGPMSPPNGSCKRNWQITRQLQHDLESTIYKATIDKCREQWAKIEQLTKMQVLTRREREDVEGAKYGFTATISADYQQSKLIPSWGKTEQPGSTYYLQKVSHDVFGVVDHSKNNSVVYLFNERVGPKYTDHTLFLNSLLESAPPAPSMDSPTCHFPRQRHMHQQEILVNVPLRLHEGRCERQIQHEAKPSAVFALEPRPECNNSRMEREKAVH